MGQKTTWHKPLYYAVLGYISVILLEQDQRICAGEGRIVKIF
jgi:hypothetical protein